MSSSTNTPKRRASEPEPTEALALISSSNVRIPPPLPYLPSDYQPSPESQRQFFLTSGARTNSHLLLDNLNTHNQKTQQQQQQLPGKRQRSQSINYGPLAIESIAHGSEYATNVISAPAQREHFELVPYHEWTVISRNDPKGQLVLYNQDSQSISVQNYIPEEQFANLNTSIPISLNKEANCPYCCRPLETSKSKHNDTPNYMDRNYFRLLASSKRNVDTNVSPSESRSSTFSTDANKPSTSSAQNLNVNAFNQGYYSKFFVELNKLGKGFRGSVFLCEHMLDGVKLGKYAIKKVAIGNNHPWLVRMLREVHLLERLRHPNIVSYKHSWLEYSHLTPFGPEVPCLFILMECANGGNLEEYFESEIPKENQEEQKQQQQQQQQQKKKRKEDPVRRMSSKDLKRERIQKQLKEQESFEKEQQNVSEPIAGVERRLLSMAEIWSLFLDIVQGLAHLHQQNIVHRDLKPPNLLLQYDSRNRNGMQSMPRVLISDFGECEDLDSTQTDENRTGATGTMEFMAPEHVRLDPRGRNTVDYSPKADMWSLGMVLYYLCYSRLPYNVIDDVDLLREEILSFKDVRFPVSRFDIYNDNPILHADAMNNSNIGPDIPNELKLLIRMLLSIDPTKRPSCNEILSKLRSIGRDDSSLFQTWEKGNPSSPSTSLREANLPQTADSMLVQEKKAFETSESDELDVIASISSSSKRSSDDSHNHHTTPKPKIRKRHGFFQSKRDQEGDTIMAQDNEQESEHDEDDVVQRTSFLSPPRLLLDSPDNTRSIQQNKHNQILKTATVILKVTSCAISCPSNNPKPITLYPVLFFALLDFWRNDNSSPSFTLIVLHISWIMVISLFSTNGLCQT